MPIYVGGRKVKLCRREKSQTVNVYVNNNVESIYDPKLRIHNAEKFVNDEYLQQQSFPTIDEMVEFLVQYHDAWIDEEVMELDYSWASEVIPEVEAAIDRFIEEFARSPYLHRKESSIHCELYCHLTRSRSLSQQIDFGNFKTRAVHKEWPETVSRPDKDGHKGRFDLVILGSTASATEYVGTGAFCKGLIRPAVVIEVGLNYGIEHLKDDVEKLSNSRIKYGYLVHLARPDPDAEDQTGVKEYVCELIQREASGGARVAYAEVSWSKIQWRRLGDPCVREKPVGLYPRRCRC